ncbi:hypothetical protein Tco_1108464 [Tanacetum coccineum]
MMFILGSTLLLVLPPFCGILAKARQKTLFPSLPNIMWKHYATLVAYLTPFHKYPEPFLCLIGISRNYTLDEDTYPKFVRDNNEENGFALLYPNCGSLQKVRVGRDGSMLNETAEIVAEDAAPVTRRPKKVGILSAFTEFMAGSCVESGGWGCGLTYPTFFTYYCRVTEREDEDQTNFMAGANLRTITAPPRFVISSNSSHHSGANIAEAEVDSFARPSIPLMTMTTLAEHTVGGFSGLTGSDFIVGGIRTVVRPDTDLQKVYVPQWSVTNGSCLDDGRTLSLEDVDEVASSFFFASIRGMEHDELFTEFNVGVARQISLSAELGDEERCSLRLSLLVEGAEAAEVIRLRNEFKLRRIIILYWWGRKIELMFKVADLAATVKVREQEVADLDAVVTSVKVHNDNLSDQVHMLEDDRMREMNENFDKLDIDLVELALHLEERFYPHLLTTISGRRWLLTHGLELAIAKCLNSTEYLSALGAAIGKDVWNGVSNFSLIIEFNIHKNVSWILLWNLITFGRISLHNRLGLIESQPHVDQLMVPIHHSPDQRVIGASALSLSLDVRMVRKPNNESVLNNATGGNVNPFPNVVGC